jgi:hypothetical protein
MCLGSVSGLIRSSVADIQFSFLNHAERDCFLISQLTRQLQN